MRRRLPVTATQEVIHLSYWRRFFGVALTLLVVAAAAGCGGGGGGGTTDPGGGGGGGGGGGTPTPPNPPTNVQAARHPVQVTHVNVTWTASSSTNVVAYNVYRKLSNQTSFSRVATVPGTNFTDTNIDSSVVFDQIQYYVRAVNSSSLESANSNTATVPATVPGGGGPPPPPPF